MVVVLNMQLSPKTRASHSPVDGKVKDWQPEEIILAEVIAHSMAGKISAGDSASVDASLGTNGNGAADLFQEVNFPHYDLDSQDTDGRRDRLTTHSGADDQVVVTWEPPVLHKASLDGQGYHSWVQPGVNSWREDSEELKSAQEQAVTLLQETKAQAEAIIAQVRDQADEIVRTAQRQADEIKARAKADGLKAADAETKDLLCTANTIVEEVNAWRDDVFSKSEMMVLRLVIEIAQSIFGDGLPLDPETLGQAFERSLAEAKTLGDLRVYVHPEDAVALGPHWAQRRTSLSGQKIELVPSDIIKRGGCFVEGQYGSVDARVETQFQMAQDTLLRKLPQGGERV